MDKLTSAASSVAQRIFENIIFLEEVFVGGADKELPDVPVLELARCFELRSVTDH
jgi:hypothetical protein